MLDSLFKKLFVLSTTTLMLTLFIIVSFAKVAQEQRVTKADLDQIIDLQLSVDLLRSQLWVFLQYGDEASLSEVDVAQAELATKLTAYKKNNSQLGNIQRMNQSLNALLNKEKQVYFLSINGLDDKVGEYQFVVCFIHVTIWLYKTWQKSWRMFISLYLI